MLTVNVALDPVACESPPGAAARIRGEREAS
jgi:hypothetical protein